MMKTNSHNISSKLILGLVLLLAPCMTVLAGMRNYVFVENGPQFETAKYYYGNYEKVEPNRDVYTITTVATLGTVTTSPLSSATAGTTVTVNTAPEAGYHLASITVTDENDDPVTVTGNHFTMPACDVTVSATFQKLAADNHTYIQVTDNPANGDWTGIYIIGHGGIKAFTGAEDISSSTSYHGSATNITVSSGGEITSGAENCGLVYISLAGNEGGQNYYVLSYYCNRAWRYLTYSSSGLITSNGNNLYSNNGNTTYEHEPLSDPTSNPKNTFRWYITNTNGNITFQNKNNTSYYLTYNDLDYFAQSNDPSGTGIHSDLKLYKQINQNGCSNESYNQLLAVTPNRNNYEDHIEKFPYAASRKYTYKQYVHPKEEGIPAYIESIGFILWNAASNASVTIKNNVAVYLGDTTEDELDDWVDTRNLTKVYEGPMNFYYPVDKKWEITDFSFNQVEGYAHDTNKNLIVVIHDKSNAVVASSGFYTRGFFYRQSENAVQLYNCNDSEISVSTSDGLPYFGASLLESKTPSNFYPYTHFCGLDYIPSMHNITIDNGITHGSVTASTIEESPASEARAGVTVTLTATPDASYDLSSFTVTKDSNGVEVEVTNNQFIMPDDNVTVTATFVPHPKYIKTTDTDENLWAGRYILAVHEGGGGPYSVNGVTTLTSLTSDLTMSSDRTQITREGSSQIFVVEYGGVWEESELIGTQDACYIGHPYYFIYRQKSNGTRDYYKCTGGNTTGTTSNFSVSNYAINTRPSTDKGFRWLMYSYDDGADGRFLIRSFYSSTAFPFLRAMNNTSSAHYIQSVTCGTNHSGYSISDNYGYVYAYKWEKELYSVETNQIGDGSVALVDSTVIQGNTGKLAYEGTTVIISITTQLGNALTSLSITDGDNNSVDFTGNSDGTYEFTMPSSNVTINVIFSTPDCLGEISSAPGSSDLNNESNHTKYPYSIYHRHSYKQIIYSNNGANGIPSTITSIGFRYYVSGTANQSVTCKNNVSIYLCDTDLETLSDWVDINTLTKVYEGPMNFAKATDIGDYKYFVFNQNGCKFEHDPNKNLLVTIHDHSDDRQLINSAAFYFKTGSVYVELSTVNSTSSSSALGYIFDANGKPRFPSNHQIATGTKSTVYPAARFCGPMYYTVTCVTGLSGGEISSNKDSAAENEIVTITATPETGYTLSTLSYNDGSSDHSITVSGNTGSFTMPAANVTVTATFTSSVTSHTLWTDVVDEAPDSWTWDGESSTINITCAEDLAWLISVVNGFNGCVADDLDGKTIYVTQPMIDMFEYIWVPIGYSSSTPFSGTFDGQCNVISGLHIDQDSYQEVDEVEDIFGPMEYAGMFGYTKGATIKNTFVFLGSNDDDEHGHRDWMTCQHNGGYLGMLVGYGEDLDMEFCYAANALGAWGNLNSVGGLVGCAHSDNPSAHVIKASMANGHFFYKNTGPSIVNLGGLVGSSNIPVENCFAIPMDSRYCSAYTSNLIGFTAPTITNKGAIVGSAGATSDVTNVYSHPFATDGFDKIVGNATGTLSNTKWYAVDTCTTPYTNVTTFTKATERTYGSYSTNNTIDGTPFCDALNSNIAANYGYKWITPPTTSVNGGYPLIVRPNDVAGSVLNSYDAKHHLNVLIFHDVNAMPSILQALDDGSKEGDNSSFGILMYNNGVFDTNMEIPADANFFIDENVAVKQDGNGEINAAVGVTFDNTAGNGEMDRDWHVFSSAIAGGKIGINYGQQTSTHPTSTNDLTFGTDYSLVQNDAAVYFPDGITTAISNPGKQFDLYSFYEPEYHWINLKRASGNHWHEDSNDSIAYGPNETVFIPGKGYLVSLGNNTTADNNFMQAKGVLNNGHVTVPVTADGEHLTGYNLIGNPYQSYLDFNKFANANKNLWANTESIGYKSYLIYNADKGGFVEYLVDNAGVSFSQGAAQDGDRYINMHQGFFVVKNGTATEAVFEDTMRVINQTPHFRDELPAYPLINLFCTDSDGKMEISVIEFERPRAAGSLKMMGMLGAKGNMYIHWDGENFSNVFLEGTPEYVPVWFNAAETGVFTMTWSTANGDFSTLRLIDNLTGANIDMLTTDNYSFFANPSDLKARFRLVFSALGIEEETTESGENFAFINGNELVVTGEGELSFIDLSGRVLATEHVSGQQSHIAMPKVAVGMYMLRLANAEGVRVQKIVIRK